MSNRNPTFLLGSHRPLSPSLPPSLRLFAASSLLPFPVLSLAFSLSLSPFAADHLREFRGSPLFVLFPPPFQPDPRDSHEYSSHDLLDRLGREKSSFTYRSFCLFLSLSLSLSCSYPSLASPSVYLIGGIVFVFSSLSIAPNAKENGNGR